MKGVLTIVLAGLTGVALAGGPWVTRMPGYYRASASSAVPPPTYSYVFDMQFNGADGNSNWVDSGIYSLTWYSTNGAPNTFLHSSAQYKSSPCSLRNVNAGNRDGVTPLVDDSRLELLASNNWTFECWVFPTNQIQGQERGIFSKMKFTTSYAPMNIIILGSDYGAGSSNRLTVQLESLGGGGWDYSIALTAASDPMFSTSAWTHIAVERLNTSIFVYTGGVCRATQTVAGGYSLYNNDSPWLIGGASYNDATKRCFPGYIDDARLTFVSKYGGTNYTP